MIGTSPVEDSFGALFREMFKRELFRQMRVVPWRRFDRVLFYLLVLVASAALILNVIAVLILGV